MTEVADRYSKVAEDFTRRVESVPPEAWEKQSPCAEWKARDVVRHVVETSAYFLGRAGVELTPEADVETDPARAWTSTRDQVLDALRDPTLASREFDSQMGPMTLEKMVGMFGVADVLIHTWDLSRAAGLDDRLDPDEVHRVYDQMLPNDAMLRQGTAFGPKVDIPDDADEQAKLLAFTGRQP